MAKAPLALALWLCISLPVFADTPSKKPPIWGKLNAEQQQILAPLAADWENIEPARKRKWLGIAKRYPKMRPDEQARVQRRMQAWAKLTPKERQAARERYKKIEKLPPDKKRGLKQKWDEYNRIPERERQDLVSPQHKSTVPKAALPTDSVPPPTAPTNPVAPAPVTR